MKICLIASHPRTDSLCMALAAAYVRGASEQGHEIRVFNVYDLKFDPSLTLPAQELEPDLLEVQAAIGHSDHLVLVFPTWWYGMPSRLKGLIDRVMVSGWAFRYDGRTSIVWRKLLKGRSARVIYTSDTPGWIVSLFMHDPVWHAVHRGILGFVGFRPIRRTLLSSVKLSGPEQRKSWIAHVETLGRKAR